MFPEEIRATARRAVGQMRLVPVLAGTASRNNGLQLLLDAIVDLLPSPADIGPVVGFAPPPASNPHSPVT